MQSTIKKYMKIRKLILRQVFYRMKLPGTCSLSKENEVTGDMLTIKGES